AKLRDTQELHQRQADSHYPAPAESEDTAVLGHERIHLRHNVYVVRWLLLGGSRDLVHQGYQLPLLFPGYARARRIEPNTLRPDASQDDKSANDGEYGQLGVDAARIHNLGVRYVQQAGDHAQSEEIESGEQRHSHGGTGAQEGAGGHG